MRLNIHKAQIALKQIEVSDPQYEILHSTKQRNLAMAGQGGGKSHTGGLLSADFIVNYPHVRGFIGANTYSQLSKSTLDRIFKVWLDNFNWINGVQYVVDKIPPRHFKLNGPKLKDYSGTISFDNGCLIFTSSLENYMAIDGTEFGWAILDETKDTKEEAVKEVITGRLRQKGMWVKDGVVYSDEVVALSVGAESWNPLYILTSPAKVPWINEWFELSDKYEDISRKIFSKTDYYSLETSDKYIVIYSSYHNEKNLPDGYIEQRKNDLIGSPNLIDMLVYGSPIAKAGGEFFSQFNRLTHVTKVPFLDGKNIHFSFDFNAKPYNTLTCWQIVSQDDGVYQVRAFKEICLPPPNNETEEVCNQAMQEILSPLERKPSVFIYGDSSGNNQTALSKEHHFQVIERVMKKYLNDSSNRVLNRNPSVSKTKAFINKIFANGLPIRIVIDESCKNLIMDLEFLKVDPDGGKLKELATDQQTGKKYEKYGHTSDSMRYFLISAFEGLFEKN